MNYKISAKLGIVYKDNKILTYICMHIMHKMHRGAMNNIGYTIRRVREQRGYSQEFMASRLNITQATYARIESQEINLSIERLHNIADILKTNVIAFFDSPKNQIVHEGGYNNGSAENQEMLKKLVLTLENENAYFKKEIEFLHTIISSLTDKKEN